MTQEFPKMVYPFGRSETGFYAPGEEPAIVQNAQEEDALMDVRPADLIPKPADIIPKRAPGRPKKGD